MMYLYLGFHMARLFAHGIAELEHDPGSFHPLDELAEAISKKHARRLWMAA